MCAKGPFIFRICYSIFLLAGIPLTMGFSVAQPPKLTLRFVHKAGDQPLELYTTTYTNPFGEPFLVNRFKYYLSHITISGTDNKAYALSDKPVLIDEADSATKSLELSLPAHVTPRVLSFEIGVDSIYQVSGLQSGDLDPLKGMFWTWNTGYIFAKLEGKSDSSHAPAHYFTFDVGGYKAPNKACRTVTLNLPGEMTAGIDQTITLSADVLKWFNGVSPVRIGQTPSCHQPGKLALQIADNYATMFSIIP